MQEWQMEMASQQEEQERARALASTAAKAFPDKLRTPDQYLTRCVKPVKMISRSFECNGDAPNVSAVCRIGRRKVNFLAGFEYRPYTGLLAYAHPSPTSKSAPYLGRSEGVNMRNFKMSVKKRSQARVNPLALSKMLKAMTEPASWQDIQDECGLSQRTLGPYIAALRKEKIIYLAGWEKDSRGCHSIRLWKLGDKEDARKPKPKTDSQRSSEYQKRQRVRKAMEGIGNASRSDEVRTQADCRDLEASSQ